MPVPSVIFREYDIRGAAERDLTDEAVVAIGAAIAGMLQRPDGTPARLVLARDCRLSSPRLHAAMSEGLLRAGAHVIDLGVGPTPYLYFAARHLGADGGVMVTGSHNPAGDNGFKITRGDTSLPAEDLQRLRASVEAGAPGTGKRGEASLADAAHAYVGRLRDGLSIDPALRVVVDAGNGAGGPLALAAMRAAGLDPVPLFCDMDGRFPNHHPDPSVEENLLSLSREVRARGARVGLAYDGDADRLGVVDRDGSVVWADELMVIFARSILRRHPGAAIVGEVRCSQSFFDDVVARGGQPVMWKAGHSRLRAELHRVSGLLAGDFSGHYFFADRYFGFDDALYASLRLLEILSGDARSLREMLADAPAVSTTKEIRVECAESLKFEVVRRVIEHYVGQGQKVVTVDGARIGFDASSWGLVRASNTGPALVMRFEGATARERDSVRADVERVVTRCREELAQPVSP